MDLEITNSKIADVCRFYENQVPSTRHVLIKALEALGIIILLDLARSGV